MPSRSVLSGLFILIFIGSSCLPLVAFSRALENSDSRVTVEKAKEQAQRGVKILDSLRSSVKERRASLEKAARDMDGFLGLPPVYESRRREDLILRNADPYYDAMSSQKVHDRKQRSVTEIQRANVKARATALLVLVGRWSQMDQEQILKLSTDDINNTLNEAVEIADYYGYDTEKLTRLYKIGKETIRKSLFELPENTHPDDDHSYEAMRKRAVSTGLSNASDSMKPAFYVSFRNLFDTYYENATEREIEIAEFMAKKQEYRVLLLKRVTFNYIRALLLSSKPLPPCNVKTKTLKYNLVNGKKIPYLGCPDESLDYLKKYVSAIQKLQHAEADNFLFHSQQIITQQQLTADFASALPVVGDVIDWYKLLYGMYSKETLSGHCFSRLDFGIEFTAAVLPFVSSAMIKGVLKRNADLAYAQKGAFARFLINMSELSTGINQMTTYSNLRRGAYAARAEINRTGGNAIARVTKNNPAMENLAERWGVSAEQMEDFAKSITDSIDLIEQAERGGLSATFVDTAETITEQNLSAAIARIEKTKNATNVSNEESIRRLIKAEKLLNKQRKHFKQLRIISDTITNASTEVAALKQLKKELPEIYELALKEAEKVLADSVLSVQPSKAEVLKASGMVPEHVEEILAVLQQRAGKFSPGENVRRGGLLKPGNSEEENVGLIMRHVNEYATVLIKSGVDTKPMFIKGKSSDWGVHRAYIPVDQAFSKLANPKKATNGVYPSSVLAEIAEYNTTVQAFYKELGNQKHLYSVDLKIKTPIDGKIVDLPVMVIKDTRLGHNTTATLFPNGTYRDELKNIIPAKYIDSSVEPKALRVIAVPDENGIPVAITADYDVLAHGFKTDIAMPDANPTTGYSTAKQNELMEALNRALKENRKYPGTAIHHGPDVLFAGSPGFQDPRVTAIDVEHGVLQISKCDFNCMKQWCTKTGNCKLFGFPNTPICYPANPTKPCIKVDPFRSLKDYMHAMRLKGYNYYPNANWGWGKYNITGGWTMVNYMEADAPVIIQALRNTNSMLREAKNDIVKSSAKSMLEGFKYATECPYGKRASDFIEAGQ